MIAAVFFAFSHGAHDVGNAAAPLSILFQCKSGYNTLYYVTGRLLKE